MKDVFMASLIRNGVLGGAICLTSDAAIYRTNKLTVPAAYRRIELTFSDIATVHADRFSLVSTVTIALHSGQTYRFLVFGAKRFLSRLAALRVPSPPSVQSN